MKKLTLILLLIPILNNGQLLSDLCNVDSIDQFKRVATESNYEKVVENDEYISYALKPIGKEDPETAKAFEKALEMNQWTERLKSVCAAQAGMVASGLQVDVLRDCDRIQQIENSIKSRNDSGVESGETNGNGTDENATEDSEGLRPTGV